MPVDREEFRHPGGDFTGASLKHRVVADHVVRRGTVEPGLELLPGFRRVAGIDGLVRVAGQRPQP